MTILGPALVIVGIGFLCWLLFNLAVFALPVYVGLTVGIWAIHNGAGPLGGIVAGLAAGGVTFGIGQLAVAFIPWAWLRFLVVLAYAVPAAVAGYSATHGIAQMAISSSAWQATFAAIGATAVGVTAVTRIAGMSAPGQTGRGVVRT